MKDNPLLKYAEQLAVEIESSIIYNELPFAVKICCNSHNDLLKYTCDTN